MIFPELTAELERRLGAARVFDQRYPELGSGRAENADLVLRLHADVFDVGGVEKGEWVSIANFSHEEAACDYMLSSLTRVKQDMIQLSVEENQRRKAVSDSVNQVLNEKFGL